MWPLPSSLCCGTLAQPSPRAALPLQKELTRLSFPPGHGGVFRPCRPSLPVDHPSPARVGHTEKPQVPWSSPGVGLHATFPPQEHLSLQSLCSTHTPEQRQDELQQLLAATAAQSSQDAAVLVSAMTRDTPK